MAKIKEEDLRLNVIVNGDSGRKKIMELEQAVASSNNRIREMRKEMTMLAREGQTNSARYKELSQSIKDETAAIKQNKEQMNDLRSKLSLNSMTIGELSKRVRELQGALKNAAPGTKEWDQLNNELRTTEARLKQLKGTAGGAGSSINGLTGTLGKAAGAFTAVLMVGRRVVSMLSGAFNTIKDFEQANVNLATILGKDVGLIFDLTNQAKELGATTRYTASEVTGLQTELAKLGFTQREILQMSQSVLNFATAVGSQLPESAALAGSTLRMFGLRASETEDVMATLALSTNKSALNFSYLQTSMSIVGPVARTFGFSVKDTTALLGTLANAGFDASSAATATRNIILNLANANGKLAKALGEPIHTFPELIDGLKTLNDKGVDLATTLELTDKRSVAAFNAFLSGAESAKALRDELEDTGGVLQDIADKRMNTLSGSIDSLKSAWERFILSMENSKGVLKDVVDLLTDIVRGATPGKDVDPGDTARRTQSYVGGLWNMYFNEENGVDLINQAIQADEQNMERGLKEAERKLESASGILAKRRAKKEVEYWQQGLAVMAGARQELSDRLLWNAGAYHSGSGTGSGDGGPGDDDKNKKAWSLQSDEAFLTAKAELTRQFNQGQIESQEEYEKRLYELEVSSLEARLATGKEKGAARAKIESEIQDKTMEYNAKAKKAREKAEADEKKAREKAEADERKARKEHLDQVQKSFTAEKDAHDAARLQIENEWDQRLLTVKKGSKQEKQLLKQKNSELLKEDARYLGELRTLLEEIVKTGIVNGVELTSEELQAYKKKLADTIHQINQNAAADAANEKGSYSGKYGGEAELFGIKASDWDLFFDNLEKGKLGVEDLGLALKGIGEVAQEGFKLANQAIQLTNAKEKKALDEYKKGQDSRKKALEERYRAGLMTESQYNAEVAKMEEELQAKEEEAELEAARRTKTMSIIESIINTALAATKALAQGGFPAGAVMAGIVTALGAAQTAMIAAQPVGYAGGGYIVRRRQDGKQYDAVYAPDKRGYVSGPTVLVGEEGGEYVIPAEALQNPQIRMVADTIESARRSGSLRSLRMEAISPSMAVSGRAAGGYTSGAAATDTVAAMAELSRLSETVDRLNAVLENGIRADVSMLGKHGLVDRINEYERAKNRGNLYDRDTNQSRSSVRSRSGR